MVGCRKSSEGFLDSKVSSGWGFMVVVEEGNTKFSQLRNISCVTSLLSIYDRRGGGLVVGADISVRVRQIVRNHGSLQSHACFRFAWFGQVYPRFKLAHCCSAICSLIEASSPTSGITGGKATSNSIRTYNTGISMKRCITNVCVNDPGIRNPTSALGEVIVGHCRGSKRARGGMEPSSIVPSQNNSNIGFFL
jgi:hypothetical protein